MNTSTSVIDQTVAHVKETLANAEGGHDWWHIHRVWQNTKTIAASEECDRLVVELAALLHDIADAKFYDGDESVGPRMAREWMESIAVEQATVDHVVAIIENMSFKNSLEGVAFSSKEMEIVQDADRLDAIGAIGIARAFNYGGFKGRIFYDPDVPPNLNMTKEEYKKSAAPTINHFYEKLLLLKDKMNTPTARAIAEERHAFMEQYLDQFYKEWSGK